MRICRRAFAGLREVTSALETNFRDWTEKMREADPGGVMEERFDDMATGFTLYVLTPSHAHYLSFPCALSEQMFLLYYV